MHIVFDNFGSHWYIHPSGILRFCILQAVRMYTHPTERVRFGAFELDLRTGELRPIEAPNSNNKVLLREQMFQVMRMLVERDGTIVTREEIKSRLWADHTTIDFDQGINSTIKALRRALGDSAANPRYIETLGRRGYRLMPTIECPQSARGTALGNDREHREQPAVEISENTAGVQGSVQREVRPRRWKAAVVLGSAVMLLGLGYISWRHFRAITPPKSGEFRLCSG